jgi:hypothetical protein
VEHNGSLAEAVRSHRRQRSPLRQSTNPEQLAALYVPAPLKYPRTFTACASSDLTQTSQSIEGGNFKAKRLKIKRANLGKVLNVIYKARSKYLHAGDPMFWSPSIKGGEKWDTDSTFGMIADNRSFSASQKLPYAYFFRGPATAVPAALS